LAELFTIRFGIGFDLYPRENQDKSFQFFTLSLQNQILIREIQTIITTTDNLTRKKINYYLWNAKKGP